MCRDQRGFARFQKKRGKDKRKKYMPSTQEYGRSNGVVCRMAVYGGDIVVKIISQDFVILDHIESYCYLFKNITHVLLQKLSNHLNVFCILYSDRSSNLLFLQ